MYYRSGAQKSMIRHAVLGLGLASLAFSQASLAQTQEAGRPDVGDSWKYFYFHNSEVSEETARADVIECHGYASSLVVSRAGTSPTYTSVPYTGTNALSPGNAALAGAIGGLIGGVIVGFMDAGERRAMERANLRRCFGFKGYDRYEMSKEDFKAMMEGEAEEVRARLVVRITGDKPASERLVK